MQNHVQKALLYLLRVEEDSPTATALCASSNKFNALQHMSIGTDARGWVVVRRI